MWSLLHNPSAWTHTSSVVGSCFIYKMGMLTGQRFQAELSPSFVWKFTEFRAETPPHAFGIPKCVTPPRLRNSSPRNPPSPSEFQDAARGMVWIFSGITHSCWHLLRCLCSLKDVQTLGIIWYSPHSALGKVLNYDFLLKAIDNISSLRAV